MDVAVIGAGIAGLACARELSRAGMRVIVLEARDRIGGRIWTLRGWGERPFELGAMFVHGEHAATMDVVREAGLTVEDPVWGGGRSVVLDGEGTAVLWDAEREVAALGADDRPLTEVLAERGWPPSRRAAAYRMFEQIWCADVSLLSAAGVARVERAWTSGHRDRIVTDGYDRITDHLASGLEIVTGRPVRRVEWRPGRVTAGGIEADACVITVPPSVVASGGLVFDPAFPSGKGAADIALDGVLRIAVRLEAPAPETLSVLTRAGLWGTTEGAHVLSGWIGGPAALRAARVPIADLVSRLRDALPWLDVADVRTADWTNDPWSLGGYSYPRAGALDAPSRWAEPVERTLYFAGESTCGDRHPATVHGAYESGLRAAREIVEQEPDARQRSST